MRLVQIPQRIPSYVESVPNLGTDLLSGNAPTGESWGEKSVSTEGGCCEFELGVLEVLRCTGTEVDGFERVWCQYLFKPKMLMRRQ